MWLVEYFDNHNEFPKISKMDHNLFLVNWIKESWENIYNHDIIKNSFHFCGYGNENIKQEWKQYYFIK